MTRLEEGASSDSLTASTVDAVAAASALVGETVLDSPSSRDSDRSGGRGINRHRFTEYELKRLMIASDRRQSFRDDNAAVLPAASSGRSTMTKPAIAAASKTARPSPSALPLSSSIWTMDLGMTQWWQKRREQQQRDLLRKQAEEQRRKIYQAEHDDYHHHTLEDNVAFQNFTNNLEDSQDVDHNDGGGMQLSSIHASKSGLGVSVNLQIEEEDKDFWTPSADIEPETETTHCPFLLEKEQRQSLAMNGCIPQSICYSRWKRIYSLARDGDSFQNFLQRVERHHHTLLVVKTSRLEVFGGYADSPWRAQHQGNPEFYGSAQASLFKIDPGDKSSTKVFSWTGINRYIQYVDLGRKMLAFGGGGEEGAFGLCLESDFQRGSTGTCATFQNEPLCSGGNFDVVDVECYGFLTGSF